MDFSLLDAKTLDEEDDEEEDEDNDNDEDVSGGWKWSHDSDDGRTGEDEYGSYHQVGGEEESYDDIDNY